MLEIPREELHFTFARAGGPGGQNVNKISSKVLLRWNPTESTALPPDVKGRFLAQHRSRLTKEGDFLITSQRYRDQARNIEDCLEKLRELIREVAAPPKLRKASRPTKASREQRLQEKRRRSQLKARRRKAPEEQ